MMAASATRRLAANHRLEADATIISLGNFSFKVPFPFLSGGELIFAQDVFIELHIDPEEISKPFLDPLLIGHDVFSQKIGVNVDTDRPHHPKFFADDRDRGALEPAASNVQ